MPAAGLVNLFSFDIPYHPHPQGIIQFGLLLLVATPIIRMAFSILVFAM